MPEPSRKNQAANAPQHGSMVVYRHEAHDGHERYRTAVVIGPALTEPVADRLWIGVRLPRHDGSNRIDLIDVATIIDVQPSQPGEPPSAA